MSKAVLTNVSQIQSQVWMSLKAHKVMSNSSRHTLSAIVVVVEREDVHRQIQRHNNAALQPALAMEKPTGSWLACNFNQPTKSSNRTRFQLEEKGYPFFFCLFYP